MKYIDKLKLHIELDIIFYDIIKLYIELDSIQ